MHPLERRLRRRRRSAARLAAAAGLVLLGSAGVLAPGVNRQRALRERIEDRTAELRRKLIAQQEVNRFESEALPKLERALALLASQAPEDDLPAGTRAAVKRRFEAAGAEVEKVEIGERGPVPAPHRAEVVEDDALDEEVDTLETFEGTPIRVVGRVAWEHLGAVLRAFSGDDRLWLVRAVTVERDPAAFPDVRFTLDSLALHVMPLEPFERADDWDDEAFAVDDGPVGEDGR